MARAISNDGLSLKLSESLTARVPQRPPRDIRLPSVANEAMAVIGVRRGGKTSFLHRHTADRLSAGDDPGTHLLISLEDERLIGMTAEDLGWLLEEPRRVVGAPCGRPAGARCTSTRSRSYPAGRPSSGASWTRTTPRSSSPDRPPSCSAPRCTHRSAGVRWRSWCTRSRSEKRYATPATSRSRRTPGSDRTRAPPSTPPFAAT